MKGIEPFVSVYWFRRWLRLNRPGGDFSIRIFNWNTHVGDVVFYWHERYKLLDMFGKEVWE